MWPLTILGESVILEFTLLASFKEMRNSPSMCTIGPFPMCATQDMASLYMTKLDNDDETMSIIDAFKPVLVAYHIMVARPNFFVA